MAVVSGNAQINVGLNQSVTSGLVTAQTLPASIQATTQYANGTGAGQIDLVYAKQLSLVASTPQTLDLTSLTDLSGATVSFARVRVLVIQVVTSTATYKVTLGNAAANPWDSLWGTTGTQVVYAGTTACLINDPTSTGGANGAVTSGTSKNLKIDPGSNNITINLMIAGCSAA